MSAVIFTSLPEIGGHTTITLSLVPILQDCYRKVIVVAKEIQGHGTSGVAAECLRQLGAEVICLAAGSAGVLQLTGMLRHLRENMPREDSAFLAMGMRHLSPLLAMLLRGRTSCYYHIAHELTPAAVRRLRMYSRFFRKLVFISPATEHAFALLGGLACQTSWAVQPSDLSIVGSRGVRRGGPPRFGFVGRLNEAKGSRILLEFAKRESCKCELHVAGSGEYADEFRAAAETPPSANGVSVRYWGAFSPANRREFYAGFFEEVDYLVVPSQDEWEGIPTVILEAIQFGVPVIATVAGGMSGFGMAELGAVDGSVIRLVQKTEVASCLKALTAADLPEPGISERCKSYYREYFGNAVVKARWSKILKAV